MKKGFFTKLMCLGLAAAMLFCEGCGNDDKSKTVNENFGQRGALEDMAYQAFTAYIDEYMETKDSGNVVVKQERFWIDSEIFEVIIDAYERTGDERYYNMIFDYFEGFKEKHKKNWTYIAMNDDLMWISTALARAYRCTGEETFIDYAKDYINFVWDRAWDSTFGGGLWWRTKKDSKNTCVNGPAACATAIVGLATGDEEYYKKAEDALDFIVDTLYQEETGRVYDAVDPKGVSEYASTYNQGTFIGANTLMYVHTGDEKYLKRARAATDYVIKTMFKGGNVMNNENLEGDLVGFKGILVRWLYLFAVNCDQPDVMEYLQKNAKAAWKNKNKKGIIWTQWDSTSPNFTEISPFSASTAVALLNSVNDSGKTSYDANELVDPYDFTRCGKLTLKHEDGVININVDATNAFLEYACIKGLDNCKKIILNAYAKEDTKVEIRTGSTDGPVAASFVIPAGSNAAKVTSEFKNETGNKRIYIVFPETHDGVVIRDLTFSTK